MMPAKALNAAEKWGPATMRTLRPQAAPRGRNGFTLVEMLVVILVLVILISIVLAVGQQVRSSSQAALTRTELKNLQAALVWYQHKTGQTPANMGAFLQGYQEMHAYQLTGGTWQQRPDVLTALPSTMVVSGTIAGGTMAGMPCVAEILDAWGAPVQYVPPPPSNPPAGYGTFYPNEGSVSGSNNFTFTGTKVQVGAQIDGHSAYYPLQDSHTPYFYSFGPQYHSTNLTPSDYLYSYAQ